VFNYSHYPSSTLDGDTLLIYVCFGCFTLSVSRPYVNVTLKDYDRIS